MKIKLILLSSVFAFFMSCKDTNQPVETTDTETVHEHSEGDSHDHDHHGSEAGTELALNDGEKWKSDEPTNLHAQNLINLVEKIGRKAPNANLEMFRNFADMLQQELNGMIQDCKMDGPDHDALHLWLEPVLNGVKELKDSPNAEDAHEVWEDLSEKITKYDQFFN